MKEKNTFAKLRAEKNAYKNKYEASQETISSQTNRIDGLDKIINIQDNQIKVLNNELKEYKSKRKRLISKLKDFDTYKNYFYKALLKENKHKARITKKLVISLVANIFMFASIVVMVVK